MHYIQLAQTFSILSPSEWKQRLNDTKELYKNKKFLHRCRLVKMVKQAKDQGWLEEIRQGLIDADKSQIKQSELPIEDNQ